LAATVTFKSVSDGRRIEVRRDVDVPDAFWRRVRAEWGQRGAHPNVAITVPIEVFASRHAWVGVDCRLYGVRVELDAGTRAALDRGRSDREALSTIRVLAPDGSVSDAQQRLSGTRFVRALKAFQERDLAKLLALKHGANFSVPGAGKTTVEFALYEAERTAGRVQRLLVVAPLSAFDSWIQDAAVCFDVPPSVHRYAGGAIPAGVEVLLINYQRLSSSYDTISAWVQDKPTLVVLDEAHRMKRGRDGEWGTACLDLSFLAARRDVLTGTPAPQHPSDLAAILDFIWPGQALRVLPSDALLPSPSPASVGAVTPAIAPLFVRTTKNELHLREPIKRVITVALEGLQKEIYNSLRARFSALVRTQRDRVGFRDWGEIVMYLLEAATNPALLPAGSSTSDPIEFRHPPLAVPEGSSLRDLLTDYATYETPAKFVQLAALVNELADADRKVIVWSNFVRNLESLERMLARHQPAVVHGGIPSEISQPDAPRRREDELARFRTDSGCYVLLANPAAMGEGVSLHQVCHDAIYLDRTFNAGQYLQSIDRIHRLGLPENTETYITFLLTHDTIDEAVSARLQSKAINLGIMLDDPSISTMALPDEDDVGEPLDVGDASDVATLFRHLRGEAGD
jgi:superfamily II DNA or RNA helicase